jgi:hypothetical protein
MTAIALAALLTVTLPTDWSMCATTGPRIVRHDAFPGVFERYPERYVPGAFYVATDDCDDIGEWRVLVVAGRAYFVMVADCAAAEDVAYRRAMGYVADVGKRLWERNGWPYCPIAAELLTIDDLFSPWSRP